MSTQALQALLLGTSSIFMSFAILILQYVHKPGKGIISATVELSYQANSIFTDFVEIFTIKFF